MFKLTAVLSAMVLLVIASTLYAKEKVGVNTRATVHCGDGDTLADALSSNANELTVEFVQTVDTTGFRCNPPIYSCA